jgi:DnaJ-class molecular chaperone
MTSNIDFYKELEITRDASDNDIKRAYRKLAIKYHPDKNQNDKSCEEKFKKVSLAYQTLSDPNKRKMYDLTGSADDADMFSSEFAENIFNDIFSNIFESFGTSAQHQQHNNGNIFDYINTVDLNNDSIFNNPNIHVSVHTFSADDLHNPFSNMFSNNPIEQLLSGFSNNKQSSVNFQNNPLNNKQSSVNFQNNNESSVNFQNNNESSVNFQNNNESSVNFQNNESLVDNKNTKPNDLCYNLNVNLSDIYNKKVKKISIKRFRKQTDGTYKKETKILKIPLYCDQLKFKNEGDESKNSTETGDIVFTIIDKEHDIFKRYNDNDLEITQNISLNELYHSIEYELELLDNKKIIINTNNLINKDNLQIIVKNKGLPLISNDNSVVYGDLYINYNVIYPKLTTEFSDTLKLLDFISLNNTTTMEEID